MELIFNIKMSLNIVLPALQHPLFQPNEIVCQYIDESSFYEEMNDLGTIWREKMEIEFPPIYKEIYLVRWQLGNSPVSFGDLQVIIAEETLNSQQNDDFEGDSEDEEEHSCLDYENNDEEGYVNSVTEFKLDDSGVYRHEPYPGPWFAFLLKGTNLVVYPRSMVEHIPQDAVVYRATMLLPTVVYHSENPDL